MGVGDGKHREVVRRTEDWRSSEGEREGGKDMLPNKSSTRMGTVSDTGNAPNLDSNPRTSGDDLTEDMDMLSRDTGVSFNTSDNSAGEQMLAGLAGKLSKRGITPSCGRGVSGVARATFEAVRVSAGRRRGVSKMGGDATEATPPHPKCTY